MASHSNLSTKYLLKKCRRHEELETALSAAVERGEATSARAEKLQTELEVSFNKGSCVGAMVYIYLSTAGLIFVWCGAAG